jgi:hypothetical protein
MSLIDAPDQAVNLARDMVFDLERDHDSQISRGFIPRQAVQEARAAFRARVVPGLHPAFESALASSSLAREAEVAVHDPAAAADLPPSRVPRSRTKVLAGLGMIAAFAVVIGWAVFTRHEPVVLARVPLPGAIGSGEVPRTGIEPVTRGFSGPPVGRHVGDFVRFPPADLDGCDKCVPKKPGPGSQAPPPRTPQFLLRGGSGG